MSGNSSLGRPRRPTLVDVAKLAGVSKSLVSQVVRGDESVSDKSTERILAAIVELGYAPNALAQGLVRQRSGVLGIVVADLHNPVFTEMIDGVFEVVSEEGFTALIASLAPNDDQPLAGLDALMRYQAEAILLAGVPMQSKRMESVAAMVPVVNLASPTPNTSRILSVHTEDEPGIRQAVDEFIALGHEQIVMIYQSDDLAGRLRLDAYLKVMADHGLEPAAFVEDQSLRPGEQAMEEAIASDRHFTAVLAVNDNTAIGALGVLRRHGRGVPDDVSVIGYDDIIMASSPLIDLTTIRQPRFEMGRAAAKLAIDLIGVAADSGTRSDVTFPSELIRRGSTGPAPTR